MEKYKAIVFDMDGTVLDTLDELTKSLNYVFARHGSGADTGRSPVATLSCSFHC